MPSTAKPSATARAHRLPPTCWPSSTMPTTSSVMIRAMTVQQQARVDARLPGRPVRPLDYLQRIVEKVLKGPLACGEWRMGLLSLPTLEGEERAFATASGRR